VVLPDGTTTDAVATNLAIGPDGAIYVSTLSGYPFAADLATVWRWDGAQATPYATGLTTAVDLDFGSDGSLYVVELRTLNGQPGRVLRIAPDGTRRVVVDGLDFPTGITVTDDAFFVTNHGTSPGIGEVRRYRR
jgi:sugar lactone lactonase YvrE